MLSSSSQQRVGVDTFLIFTMEGWPDLNKKHAESSGFIGGVINIKSRVSRIPGYFIHDDRNIHVLSYLWKV